MLDYDDVRSNQDTLIPNTRCLSSAQAHTSKIDPGSYARYVDGF